MDDRFKKIPVGYKLPRWLVDQLRARAKKPGGVSAARMIENALRSHYGLEPDDGN